MIDKIVNVNETTAYSENVTLIQKDCKNKYDWVEMVIHWKLCR